MQGAPIKVACIAGTGKSGSTLLGKLLGQIDGIADVGELINIDAQFAQGQRCGCGTAVAQCGLWSRVVAQAIGDIGKLDRGRWSHLRTRYLPWLLLPGARPLLRRHFAQLAALHRALRQVSGARIVADSSKSACYGAVLSLFPDFDVYTVHLVRDVRASEGSMYRLRQEGVGKFAARSTWWNSLRWVLVNWLTEWVARRRGGRYLRVRYEDLVSEPRRTIDRILEFLGHARVHDGLFDGSTVRLEPTHSVAGSDVRFKQGPLTLRLDERWRESLPQGNRAVVDGLTRWFRRRYGY